MEQHLRQAGQLTVGLTDDVLGAVALLADRLAVTPTEVARAALEVGVALPGTTEAVLTAQLAARGLDRTYALRSSCHTQILRQLARGEISRGCLVNRLATAVRPHFAEVSQEMRHRGHVASEVRKDPRGRRLVEYWRLTGQGAALMAERGQS